MACDPQPRRRVQRNQKAFRPVPKLIPRRRTRALPLPELSAGDVRRLWGKIQKGEPDACWPWTAGKTQFGHGRFKVGGKLYLPHRLIYALHVGALEKLRQYHGTVARHRCDNPACCNPRHLQPGTQAVNVADMFARGREPGQCKRNQEDE